MVLKISLFMYSALIVIHAGFLILLFGLHEKCESVLCVGVGLAAWLVNFGEPGGDPWRTSQLSVVHQLVIYGTPDNDLNQPVIYGKAAGDLWYACISQ